MAGADAGHTYSIAEFIDLVNGAIADATGRGVWIQGEVKKLNAAAGAKGHVYFDLADREEGRQATISVAIWRGVWTRISRTLADSGLELGNGLKVRMFGTADIWHASGRFSFKVSEIDPRFTLGDLVAQRDATVAALKRDGRYDANRRVPMPLVPLRLGIVTSAGSDALADVRKTLVDSGIGFRVVVHDARVQGDDAPRTVVAALRALDARDDLDVLLLVRGGGSKADLMAFDGMEIAAAIAECRHPVLTGIGHERDVSVADEVAHAMHKTPTAAAVALVERVRDWVRRTEDAWSAVAARAVTLLDERSRRLDLVAQSLARRPREVVRLEERRVAACADRLRLLDPVHVMRRGWSITRDAAGRVVRDAGALRAGDEIVTSVANGDVASTVTRTTTRSDA
ncbi:MAG: exodeoxyribonuclease VII large subunit [Acidimicrobiia bacterium]